MSDPPYYADGSYGYYDVTQSRPSSFYQRASKLEVEYFRKFGYTNIPMHVFLSKAENIFDGKVTKTQAFRQIRSMYPDRPH